jgi:hypothetical protein
MCMGPLNSAGKTMTERMGRFGHKPKAQLTPPPPTKTAAVVQPAGRRGRGSSAKRRVRKGTSQLTVKRPSMGGSYSGSGVNLPT